MTEKLAVLLAGERIGDLEKARNGSLSIHLDESYTSQRLPIPISVTMATTRDSYGHAVVDPWLWGLLPDSEPVLRRWASRFEVSRNSAFDLLGTPVGIDCAGAVQFCRETDVSTVIARGGELTTLDEAVIAERIRELRDDSSKWLASNGGKFSLGGAQAKTALHKVHDGWAEATGSIPTTHIFKPAIRGLQDQHVNEHVCLTAARLLGLPAAETTIEQFETESVLVVSRFDRDGSSRIHQEDLCQALSLHPQSKYEADGGPSVATIASLIRAHVPGALAQQDVRQFADALVFNWVLAGTDAHAKNYGFLLSRTGARLAPMYDVASILPYDDSQGHRVRFAMKLGDTYKLPRTDRPGVWTTVAKQLGLEVAPLIDRAYQITQGIPAAFAASLVTVGDHVSDMTEKLEHGIASRSASCLQVLERELSTS